MKKVLPDIVSQQDRIILFDAECVVCTGWTGFLLKNDRQGQFRLASVQSPPGQKLLDYAGLPLDYYETLVLIDQGEVYVRSEAILRVLADLPGIWPLSRIFRLIPLKLRDALYHRVAINRYKLFGRHQHCYVPSAEQRHRFLQ